MTAFDISNPGFEQLNAELKGYLVALGDTVQGFTQAMGVIASAATGDAAEIWKAEHKKWLDQTVAMEQDLTTYTQTSFTVHEIFTSGDIKSAQIIAG